ncbi:MAG TPA: 6-hydroxymethylpterin diphosphokinase MptE-like protein [Anaerolineales bacterium]|nr:6-hydroxymethylpterin diphosphokinase MptE-like protein [Anaerolineales bacterium]
MKQTLKHIIPLSIWNIARHTKDTIRRIPEFPAAYFHPWRRESIRRLQAVKDIHKGKRAFIIGNGPSLRQTDLTKLRNEFTFGMNRIYLLFPELGFHTTYFVSINDLVIEQFKDEILAQPMPKFLAWRSHRHFSPQLRITQLPTFIYTSYTGPRFSSDVRGRVWEGATVTNVALQLAFHMGFEKVILIGVDHNFASKGDANKTVVSQGDDLNHFAPNYFGKGAKWQLPDLDTSEIGYTLAREAYREAGREVIDATVGGKLTVFPKVDYDSLF